MKWICVVVLFRTARILRALPTVTRNGKATTAAAAFLSETIHRARRTRAHILGPRTHANAMRRATFAGTDDDTFDALVCVGNKIKSASDNRQLVGARPERFKVARKPHILGRLLVSVHNYKSSIPSLIVHRTHTHTKKMHMLVLLMSGLCWRSKPTHKTRARAHILLMQQQQQQQQTTMSSVRACVFSVCSI